MKLHMVYMQSASNYIISYMAQVKWPLLILKSMILLAQYLHSLVQLTLSWSSCYKIFSETFHLPQLHLSSSA